MTQAGSDEPRDGRLTVLLCLAFCFLFFDLGHEYNWFTFIGENSLRSEKQIKVAHSGLMVTDEPLVDTRPEKPKSVSAAYTPFFFQPIPINIATKEMLMTVKGIGPSLAENILDHRRLTGPFKNPEDLLALKGIGRKRISYFKKAFTFNDSQ